jgi:hypothetical protein
VEEVGGPIGGRGRAMRRLDKPISGGRFVSSRKKGGGLLQRLWAKVLKSLY